VIHITVLESDISPNMREFRVQLKRDGTQ